MKKFKNWLVLFVILMIVWVLLNNSFQANIIIPGVIIALLISLFSIGKWDLFSEMKFSPKAIAYTLTFIGIFLIELIKSNFDVIRRVLTPSLPINPGFVEVKTTLKSKFARMVLANAITLTPGTLTVEVIDESFFIHWIDVESDEIEAASNKIVKNFEKYLEVIYG
jgi:multicomponent Na+:H+ antiporter subunit E